MDLAEEYATPARRPPRTWIVLIILSGAALLVSWLLAYALPNALMGADLMQPFPPDDDPRFAWMIEGFFALWIIFSILVALARFMSWRQLRRIDRMGEAE